jgi:hypothetical protein
MIEVAADPIMVITEEFWTGQRISGYKFQNLYRMRVYKRMLCYTTYLLDGGHEEDF